VQGAGPITCQAARAAAGGPPERKTIRRRASLPVLRRRRPLGFPRARGGQAERTYRCLATADHARERKRFRERRALGGSRRPSRHRVACRSCQRVACPCCDVPTRRLPRSRRLRVVSTRSTTSPSNGRMQPSSSGSRGTQRRTPRALRSTSVASRLGRGNGPDAGSSRPVHL
jgi:hypothetical protein